jgi:predicted DCC family thiol-disulfide oxidoreductase YuxK
MDRIVLFDGVCNFCNASVNFIIRNDRQGIFKFAPLQSDIGRELRARHRIGDDVDSIVLIEGGQAYIKSDAAVRIARSLGGIFSLAGVLGVLPRAARDGLYDFIARNRFRIFGRKDVCMMPSPDVRERFL